MIELRIHFRYDPLNPCCGWTWRSCNFKDQGWRCVIWKKGFLFSLLSVDRRREKAIEDWLVSCILASLAISVKHTLRTFMTASALFILYNWNLKRDPLPEKSCAPHISRRTPAPGDASTWNLARVWERKRKSKDLLHFCFICNPCCWGNKGRSSHYRAWEILAPVWTPVSRLGEMVDGDSGQGHA